MQAQATGWRRPGPAASKVSLAKADRDELFEASRLAVQVLNLNPSARYVLDQLVGCYRGELIGGRMLVWPSNEFLEDRTGLSERSVRYAVRTLISEGIISSKDSANGKRFARKSQRGQIIDAFGFDLTPLLAQRAQWEQRLVAVKEHEREQKAKFEQITIARRRAQEMLIEVPSEALEAEYEHLCASSPRRAKSPAVDPAVKLWRDLLERVEIHYYAASGGNDCRHKETNKNSPDQSCYKGSGMVERAKPPAPDLQFSDLLMACRDAMLFTGPVRDMREMAERASQYRGQIGLSQDGWVEACSAIGVIAAASVFFMTLQRKVKPLKGVEPLHNAGGYFRFMVRSVREGRIDLLEEIKRGSQRQ